MIYRKALVLFIALWSIDYTFAASDSEVLCSGKDFRFVPLKINTASVVRTDVPKTIFGFDQPWYDFQIGHFRNGQVKKQTVDWLKPFAGAIYRFPGGNTYDWKRALGDESKRNRMKAAYTVSGYGQPDFGLKEFVDFLEQVDGNAIVMLNLIGPDGKLLSTNKMVDYNSKFVEWFKNTSSLKCSSGDKCRVRYWEMGNELDWPSMNWSAQQYVSRAEPLVDKLQQIDPNIKLLSLGKTAPWDSSKLSEQFNEQVASRLADKVSGVTMHPYYDGHAVPMMTSWLEKTVNAYRILNPKSKMVITEHGRWPNQKSKKWEDDWYQASGSGGAISTADFIISIMGMQEVDAAAWHALGIRGPWQLFHYDKNLDNIYPSAVYWGLRVLRDAFLDDMIEVSPSKIAGISYVGGYDMHVAAMKDSLGHVSIMGINRGNYPIQLSFEIHNATELNRGNAIAKLNLLQADKSEGDNTISQKDKFVMKTTNIDASSGFPVGACIPPLSVFSIVN